MFPEQFENLESLERFCVEQLEYHPEAGFTFAGIGTGGSFSEVLAQLGPQGYLNDEADAQQTLRYQAPIDHPTEGQRPHHQLDLLFWAFNRQPFKTIKGHFNYFSTGAFADEFKAFVDGFFNALVDKLGVPDKKTLARGREELSYVRGRHKLKVWRNAEGVRFSIQ